MHLLTMLPLTFQPLNHVISSLLGYPKVISCTKFEHFVFIRFRVMLRIYRQTNKQTDRPEHPTQADRLCRRG